MQPSAGGAGPAGSRGPARWRRRRRVLEVWAAGALASLVVTGASAQGYLEPLQTRTLDLLQRLGGRRVPGAVVIVAIDEAAFRGLGARQPISRAYLARVIDGLRRAGAAAVGLDIVLSVPTTPAEDGELARALGAFAREGRSRVVLVDAARPDSGPLADPALWGAVGRGSDRVPVDADGVIRRVAPLVAGPDGAVGPGLPLALLGHVLPGPGPAGDGRAPDLADYPYWQADGSWAPRGGPPTPLRAGDLRRINFVGPPGAFLTIPSDVVAALGDPASGEGSPAEDNPVRGRVALVGATFADSRDAFMTPVGRLPGVEVHATIVHMLATRTLLRPAGWAASLGVQLAAVLAAGLLLVWLGPLRGTLVAALGALAVGVPASYAAFHGGGYAMDFVLPVLATGLTGLGAEALARRRFRDSFGRYVGREVMEEVLAENPALRGERREVSVLVSDLRGFTTLSETLPAERVAAHLNEYFPAMIDAIFAHRGMVNDFVGDGILAVFGAPLPDADHAWRAVNAAAAMQGALETLNREWAARGVTPLRMGIGIHSGVVFAGNVGGAARVKYTVIGDTVNVAARLEGLNKELGTTALVTEETWLALGDRVEARYRGEAPVKGRARPLRVYELLAVRATPTPGGERRVRSVEAPAPAGGGGDHEAVAGQG